MKKLLPILCCLSICIISNAQYRVVKKSLTDIGLVNNSANSMVVQQDDKIVAIASIQEGSNYKIGILRYTKSGALDNSFGKNGVDTFSVSKLLPSYQGISLRSLTIQSDAKIVVAGSAWYTAGVDYLSDVFVMRLLSNGIIDSSFGRNGIVTTNISSSTGLSIDDGYAVKMQDDNKIVVAGQTYDYLQHRFLAIRYNTNGSVDNSFGSAGANVFSIGVSDDEAFALTIQSNGKIILAGESYLNSVSYRIAVARLNKTGTLDASFGSNGIVTTNIAAGGDEALAVAIQNNTRIVVSGFTASTVSGKRDAVCLRYTNSGTPDSSFGIAGKSIIDVGGNDDVINNVLIQPDNKILMTGYTTASNNISDFLSIRLSVNGSKDNTYDANGISTSSVFQQGDVANGSGILSTGKIVLAGQTANGAAKFISLTAYNKTGVVDSTFANDGSVITGIGSSDDIAYKLLRSPWDNSLLVAGIANGYWVLAKYKASTLALDPSFGVNGTISANYSNPEDPKDEPSLAIDAQAKKIYLAGYTGQKITIVRFTNNGKLDTTFANKGTVDYGLSIFYGAFGLESSDHKILLAGVRQESNSGYNFIARLNANGTTDSSFGTNGEVRNLPLTPNSIQMKRDNSTILIGGRVPKSFNGALGVLSLNLNGTTDQTFGTNGLASRYSSNANAEIYFKYNIAQDQLGRILLSGGVQGGNFKYQFSVTRFLKSGVIDSSFANNGLFVKDVSTGSYSDNYNEGISSFCSGNNCSVLTSGIKLSDGDEKSTVIIMTLKNDGSIDPLNNTTGYIDTSFYNDMYEGSFASIIDTIGQSTEVMYVAGKASNGVNSDFLLIKLQKNFAAINKAAIVQTDYQLNVSPNPAHNNIHITYNMQQAGEVTIKLTGFNGRLIQQQAIFSNAGKQSADMQIPAATLPGYYFVTLSCGKENNVSKLLVQ